MGGQEGYLLSQARALDVNKLGSEAFAEMRHGIHGALDLIHHAGWSHLSKGVRRRNAHLKSQYESYSLIDNKLV